MVEKQTSDENVILERISSLRGDILDLKTGIDSVEKRIFDNGKIFGDFQIYYTKEHAKLEAIADTNRTARIEHGTRIKILEDLIKPLIFQSRIIALVGSAFLLSVIGLLWAIFTNQITLIVP